MKFSLHFICLILLLQTSSFAQNWAPFRLDEKILYSTPDTIAGVFPGESILLAEFDTTLASGDSIIRFARNGYMDNPFLSNRMYTSLYGNFLVQKENEYKIGQGLNVLKYHSLAKPGQTILEGPGLAAVVLSKRDTVLFGEPDSVKYLLLNIPTDPINSGIILLSKNQGFLSFPGMFIHQFSDPIPLLYKRFGNLKDNLKGVKTFSGQNRPFLTGDEIHRQVYYYYDFGFGNPQFIHEWKEFIKTTVLWANADSCFVHDSIMHFDLRTGITSWNDRTFKMKNRPFNEYPGDSIPLLRPFNSFSSNDGKVGFMTQDSIMFIGSWNATSDTEGMKLLSTEMPLSFSSSYDGPLHKDSSHCHYFKRGNFQFGNPLVLTSVEEKVDRPLVKLFPNPAMSFIEIQIPEEGPHHFTVWNITGMKVMEVKIKSSGQLDIQNLPSGLYQYSVTIRNGQLNGRFVKE